MAYNPQDPNKLKDENEVTGASPPPQLSAPGSSIGQGSPPAGGMAQSPGGKAPSASGFTNVQKYISANQQQGGALGQKIAGKIDSSIGDASNKAGSAAQGYRETVNPDQFKFDAKTFDPMKVDNKTFGNLFNAPKSSYNDSSARGAIDLANKNAAQIQTNEGRGQLVGAEQTLTKGTGQNTAGLKHFDRLLFQGSGQGEAAIKNTANNLQSAQLESKLADQGNIARGIDQEAANNQATAARSARGAIGSQAKALQDQIAQSTAQQKAALAGNQNRVFDALSNRQDISDADLRSFGIDKNQFAQVRDGFDARQRQVIENEITNHENRRIVNTPDFNKRNQELLALRESQDMTAAKAMGLEVGFDLSPFFKKNDVSGFGAANAVTADQIARARALEGLGRTAGMPVQNLAPQSAAQFDQSLGSTDLNALLNAMKVDAVQKAQRQGPDKSIQEQLLPVAGRDYRQDVNNFIRNPVKSFSKVFG